MTAATEPDPGRPVRAWPAALAVLLAGALAVGLLVVWHGRARVRVVVETTRTTASAAVLRPGDCPLDVNCFTGRADATVVAAVRRHFPGSRAVDDWRLIDGVNGSTARVFVLVRTDSGTLVTLTSRCVRSGAAVPGRPIDPGAAVGPARVSVVVPGATGCSAAVVLDVPAGVAVDRRGADALAHDQDVQVRV